MKLKIPDLKGRVSKLKSEKKAITAAPASAKKIEQAAVKIAMLRRVGVKLFMLFFVCILAIVIVVGTFSYTRSKEIIQDKVAASTEQTILLAADKVESILRVYEDISINMQLDTDLISKLRIAYGPSESEFQYRQNLGNVTAKYQSFFSGRSEVQKVLITEVATGKTIGFNGAKVETEDTLKSEWFNRVKVSEGAPVWLETNPEGHLTKGKPNIALARLARDQLTGKRDFAFLIEIKYDVLDKALENLNINGEFPVVLLDPNSNLIRTNDVEKLTQPFEVILTPEKLAESAELSKSTIEDGKLVIYKQLINGWTAATSIPINKLVKETGSLLNLTYIMVGVAMLAAVGAGLFAARIIAPLTKLRTLMQEGERGNLTVRTDIKSKDEIGELGLSFNRMMEQITKLVQQTNQSANEVLENSGVLLNVSKQTETSAREIAVATEEIAKGATSLAMEAEKGNLISQEIEIQMRQVIQANQEMEQAAGEVQQVSERGTVYMSELMGKTNMTEQMTRGMVEKVDRLKESTASIRKILDVLTNMTKQTNILSLNATIEAARAGVAGKGFMVVADEIRKLAEQSKQSIEVVGQITDTIQREIDETVKVLSDAYPVFQEQITSVKEAEMIFQQVRGQMSSLTERLGGVTRSVEQLEESQLTLAEAMTNVSAVSEESSATSQEVASLSNEQLGASQGLVKLSESLEGLSASLQEQLSKFKTE